MCIAKNEEALAIDPHFAECYGNMANAWKVVLGRANMTIIIVSTICTCISPSPEKPLFFIYVIGVFFVQEKGDIDLAIRYYLTAIQVSLRSYLYFFLVHTFLFYLFSLFQIIIIYFWVFDGYAHLTI